jgi:Ca2+-binding EF-hand superfamily protein
MFEGIDQG